jgi:hypothetical protein
MPGASFRRDAHVLSLCVIPLPPEAFICINPDWI